MVQEISSDIDFPERSESIGRSSMFYTINTQQLSFFQDKGIVLPDTLKHAVLKRQVEFAAGRFCAYHALQQLNYQGAETLAIGAHRAPVWPYGYLGSISHSDGRAMAVAVSKQQWRAVGVDIERILSDEGAQPVLAQIMTVAEQEIGSQADIALANWCSLVFSAKESLFKALYPWVGGYFDFLDVEVCTCEPAHLVLKLVVSLSEHCRQGDTYMIRYQRYHHHIVTVCLLG